MTPLDWLIVILYLGGMILMSFWLGRGQESQEDYFVGGRDLPWWAVGLSTMATQSSATSFISIPAFVALKPDGGLKYLQWELAVPLSMIFIMIFLIPFLSAEAKDNKSRLSLGGGIYNFMKHLFKVFEPDFSGFFYSYPV